MKIEDLENRYNNPSSSPPPEPVKEKVVVVTKEVLKEDPDAALINGVAWVASAAVLGWLL